MANTTTKNTKAAPSHPPVAEMVVAALKGLKDRKGSSLIAIKKYVVEEYKVDATKLAPFIKKFLKSSIENGKIVQTKGTGATGSFKIGKEEKPKKEIKKPMKKAVKPPTVKSGKPTKKTEEKPKAKKAEGKVKAKKTSAKKAIAKKTKTPKPKAAKKAKTPAKKPKAVKKLAL